MGQLLLASEMLQVHCKCMVVVSMLWVYQHCNSVHLFRNRTMLNMPTPVRDASVHLREKVELHLNEVSCHS